MPTNIKLRDFLKIVFFTYHVWRSERRAGFHHLAKSFHDFGWEVLFFTTGLSWISSLQGNKRLNYYSIHERNKLVEELPNFYSYLHFTPFHSIGFKQSLINLFIQPLVESYSLFSFDQTHDFISEADLLIFESADGLLLIEQITDINKNARTVYRMSDLLTVLRKHPVSTKYEKKYWNFFDLISVPSEFMYSQFKSSENLSLDYHGISKDDFNKPYQSPFDENAYNAVWVGNGYFDHNFLQIASSCKEDWYFHIIGDVEKKVLAKNIFYYGEMPFTETIPYILNANLGLDNKSWKPDMESCTDSLKVLQYTYAGLPIILPNFLKSNRSNIYSYEPANPDSIHSSLSRAQNHPSGQDEKHSINSWHDLAARLAGPLWNQHLGLN